MIFKFRSIADYYGKKISVTQFSERDLFNYSRDLSLWDRRSDLFWAFPGRCAPIGGPFKDWPICGAWLQLGWPDSHVYCCFVTYKARFNYTILSWSFPGFLHENGRAKLRLVSVLRRGWGREAPEPFLENRGEQQYSIMTHTN